MRSERRFHPPPRIYRLEVDHECFQILVGYIPGRITDLVNDTVLNLCFRECGPNGSGEAGQVIGTNNENILYASVPQAIEYGGPILGALSFSPTHMPSTSFLPSKLIPMAI